VLYDDKMTIFLFSKSRLYKVPISSVPTKHSKELTPEKSFFISDFFLSNLNLPSNSLL